MTELQPIGIYTRDAIPYEVGVARYREPAGGQIAGDSYGMLKLLVSTNDLTLLGVLSPAATPRKWSTSDRPLWGAEARSTTW
jgi:hypothetical protein